MTKITLHNKNYMSIAVSVLIAEFTAYNNFSAAQQESNPQSATAYSSNRYAQGDQRIESSGCALFVKETFIDEKNNSKDF